MIVEMRGRTDRLWDAWYRYQAADRAAFTAYEITLRNLSAAHDSVLEEARQAHDQAWLAAMVQYRAQVAAWFRQLMVDRSVTARECQAGVEAAIAAYEAAVQQAAAGLASAETGIRAQYRYDCMAAQELWRREALRARRTWRIATGAET